MRNYCDLCGELYSICRCTVANGEKHPITTKCLEQIDELSALKARCERLEEAVNQALVYLKTDKPGNTFRLMCINMLEAIKEEDKV